jgi:hypothetical protein
MKEREQQRAAERQFTAGRPLITGHLPNGWVAIVCARSLDYLASAVAAAGEAAVNSTTGTPRRRCSGSGSRGGERAAIDVFVRAYSACSGRDGVRRSAKLDRIDRRRAAFCSQRARLRPKKRRTGRLEGTGDSRCVSNSVARRRLCDCDGCAGTGGLAEVDCYAR